MFLEFPIAGKIDNFCSELLIIIIKSQDMDVSPNPDRSSTLSPDRATSGQQPSNLDGAADPPVPESNQERQTIIYDAGRIRLRGYVLEFAGHLYPGAEFALHRIGAATNTDLRVDSAFLRRDDNGLDVNALYRVDLKSVDPSRGGCCGWGAHNGVANASLLTLDDYVNLITLGSRVFDRWLMLVWYTDEDHIWTIASQAKDQTYTMEDCFAIFDVPEVIRREVHGFGRRYWTVGQPIPSCYLARNMPTPLILSKIREVMRVWTPE